MMLGNDEERTRAMALEMETGADRSGHYALTPGTRIAEFEILEVLGEGGFGIVYRAMDQSLERTVALKEYLPATLARRYSDRTVRPASRQSEELYELGLRSFINEARLLARFDNPSLVKVFRFWEENGTAYMVMPFYDGMTLKDMLYEMRHAPDEMWIKNLLSGILDALETVHAADLVHRDIAPDNILIMKDGRPLLLDFGAARQIIANKTQALTTILKPGYAPIEQYAEVPQFKQGPWTDIYALAAVVYYAVKGRAPQPSVARMMADTVEPLSRTAAADYSARLLQAVDRAMAIKPDDRPQSIAEFRALLGVTTGIGDATANKAARQAGKAIHLGPGRHIAWIGGSAISVVLLAALAWLLTATEPQPQLPVDNGPISAPREMPPAPMPPVLLTALEALDAVFSWGDRSWPLEVVVSQPRIRIGEDPINFSIHSQRAGHAYVFMVGTEGRQAYLIFPNALDSDNRVHAGRALHLPRSNWSMVAGGPPGSNHLVAIVSLHPRDFDAAGVQREEHFLRFTRLGESGATPAPPLIAGRAVCRDTSGNECSQSYGAAKFTIEEIASTPVTGGK